MYMQGEGVARDDVQAAEWFRKAAEQGNAEAQANLGFVYMVGRGVAPDDAQAVGWLRKAAEQGNAIAQTNLGLMYSEGRSLAKDRAEAARWYQKAAEQDNAEAKTRLHRAAAEHGTALAQFYLGEMYRKSRDIAHALHWHQKAAAQGHIGAQVGLGLIYRDGEGLAKDDAGIELRSLPDGFARWPNRGAQKRK